MPPKRKAYTDAQKRAVRKYFQANPQSISQRDCIQFAANTLEIHLKQNTVSQWLSPAYTYLDNDDLPYSHALMKNRSRPNESLERGLYDWIKRMETKISISGDIVKLKASEFWHQIPEYRDQKEPAWSNGWLHGFQAKYGVKWGKKHGEIGTAREIDVDDEIVSSIPPISFLL